ncbi:lipocalin-like domain-containing protein [Dictyobacter arantiisoli]|uniref:Lipocalin-like domain-containing protein n=1 Tax=Dictyobacter arantiisoli TaxID=2014874 RepID=A0A5A5TCP0_9CHLR|nr:lipocalin-like domain-containing protein [Dictyobacter arantiisoli]GCF08916.1 hypothetical protein KDI_24800 [Dictyobacter arantiisoli]
MAETTSINKAAIIGTWCLLSYTLTAKDGLVLNPFGTEPLGYLMYGPDDYMSLFISLPHRPPFEQPDLMGGMMEELAFAAKTFIAYTGRYRIDGEEIVYEVKLSLFPNWIGMNVGYKATLSSGRLSLVNEDSTLFDGKIYRAELIWERA